MAAHFLFPDCGLRSMRGQICTWYAVTRYVAVFAMRHGSRLALAGMIALGVGVPAGPAAGEHFLTHPAARQQAAIPDRAVRISTVTEGKDATSIVLTTRTTLTGVEAPPHDAALFIAPSYVPKDDYLLGAYSANDVTRRVVGLQAPGLRGVAVQAWRAQRNGRPIQRKAGRLGVANLSDESRDLIDDGAEQAVYSLADAMRDAIWRRKTAAKLRGTLR
ncbi:MAG TPA: hypothetical protein VLS27_13475 [Gammaproteobacteria bacterium]|nr:hypothetical protein [Gammaproteobacteria bacterium]